ncbi:hemin transport protein HmuS [Klebsiella pneumoniae]|uniref:Hemin transport protein HmuS n=1 Tax=Klebsiella pneumoniae TaxID=573 RepID=A0A377TY73_KLEPN|nr:hemin transport protein HmuS [Klebsiella pneumoniae]
MPNAHPDLWQRYQATKAASTAKYARDIAAEMGISEAELTAARLGHDAVRLSDDARALIAALERVGETKCICRNEYACMSRWASSRTSTSAATPGWC